MSTSAFDDYASAYDGHFTRSPIGILQRRRVFRYLVPLLSKEKKVLEVNCGTGEDALTIAPLVHSIYATDISEAMIKTANLKKEKSAVQNVDFEVLDIRDIHKTLQIQYDLVFSDFGGLNCLSREELKTFADAISPRVPGHGKLAFVVMGRKCIWENLLFWKQNDRRFRRREALQGVETNIEGAKFLTYYYSPGELGEIFGGRFNVRQLRPIGLFIPPSYLNPYFENKTFFLRCLSFLENIFGNVSFLSNYADHYLVILDKSQV